MESPITFMSINFQKTTDYWALNLIKGDMQKGYMAGEEAFTRFRRYL